MEWKIYKYKTKENYDDIFLESDGKYLTGLCFEGAKDENKHSNKETIYTDLPIFKETSRWLDIYFSGEEPDFTPKYKLPVLTPFRKQVIDIMLKIPYGKTTTYGDIAKEIAKNNNISKMSSRAVGSAVGWNPICLIIPCHRVIGSNGNLTGYGGGLNNKIELLKEEGISLDKKEK